MLAFGDLARAAYCPRQLHYARRADDREPPPSVRERRRLAFRYRELRDADAETLGDLPIEPRPAGYRHALATLAERDDWDALADPDEPHGLVTGKDCRGRVDKIVPGDPPVPTLVSPGTPPETGVWNPQAVRAVAAAKALAWERQRPVERALVEYPVHGVVREVRLTTGKRAAYRDTVRTVRTMADPPPRVDDDAKCDACEYADECGVRTRSLRSLLGL